MLNDPYSPGALPDYLAGRADELGIARGVLGPVALGRAAGPLLAFYGARGVGKTSLLRALQREADVGDFLTVWATGRSDESLVSGLASALAHQLRDAKLEARAKSLLGRIDQVRVEFGVPGAKIAADVKPASRSVPGLEELLDDTARLVRAHGLHGLVVFVDELQDAPLGDRTSMLIALQHFDGAGSPIAVVAAGLPSLPGAVTAAATFGERSNFVALGALSPVAVAEALRVPAAELGVRWSDAAIDAALEEARGYAYKVQLLGSAAWTALAPRAAGEEVMLPHVHRAIETVERRMQTMFAARLAKASEEERRLLGALAAVADDRGDSARSAAASYLGVDPRSLSRARQSLVDKGLLESAGHGRLRFTIPGFERYLDQLAEGDG
ncbi:AAA family ATPase [Aeromicrobium sp. CF3.5]|uniref:AAA family ATPase n=1 Tax=Aeromicrobium sp. CF3.5 TaxID=3373078 RepID=UPI003EE5C8C1